tara:strand:+ start:10 stop:2829 length:2820 start_codon:yes stop_codon:yes gene_type:complete
MASIYIDANANNSKVIDPTTNNRYEYQINGGLQLPTGTRISVASSFINQKGIAGGSIEIDEDIEEELVYGYYMSDTTYGVPTTGDLMDVEDDFEDEDDRVGLDLLAPFNFVQNYLNQFINDGDTNYDNAKWAPHPSRGRTENPMPLLTVARTEYPGGDDKFFQANVSDYKSTGWSYAIPLLNKSTIKISKGVYTLSKLADIITKQLNGLELPDNVARTQFQKDKTEGTFNAMMTNRNMARQVKVEYSMAGASGKIEQTFLVDGEETKTLEAFDFNGGMLVRNHYFPKGSKTQVNNIINFEDAGDDLEFTSPFNFQLSDAQFNDYKSSNNSDIQADVNDFFRNNIRALTAEDSVVPSVFAVRPNFFQKSLDYVKQNYTSVVLAPAFQNFGTPQAGFGHFDTGQTLKPINFAPSLFAFSSDVLADNINSTKGAQSEYCFIFENNSVLPPVNKLNPAGEGGGLFPNTMYFNEKAKEDEGEFPVYFCGQNMNDHTRFETANNFPNNAMMAGTTNFRISFDDTNRTSHYKLDHLHEPRRIPTFDKFGNQLDSPSMECYYLQRTVDLEKDIDFLNDPDLANSYPELFYFEDNADNTQARNNNDITVNNLNTIAQRITGVMMRNWALKTAQKLRTIPKPPLGELLPVGDPDFATSKITHYDDFLTFDEFFRNKAEAKSAWNTTIWAKLGFTYEQICSTDSFEKVKYFNQAEETLPGFTTEAGVSSSVIPMVSTKYTTEKAAKTPDMGVEETLNSGVQYFNNADMNIPNKRAQAVFVNEDTKAVSQTNRVFQYQTSFYDYAVMGLVQTTGRDIEARQLPTLSKHGYFLITSNIGTQGDIVNNSDPTILLDTVPKSNLANQDFIFNRNDLVHTLTNPVSLNSIQINILNPDLTNPTLAGDSSVLLRIDYPLPKETVIRNNVLDNQAIQFIESTVEAQEKQAAQQQKNI